MSSPQPAPPSPLQTPTRLGDLVDYQEGAVVSRTLTKLPAGSLTLFAFDSGQGVSEHTTPHEAVVQVLDGAAEVSIAGDVSVVEVGQAVRLPAGVPHALAATRRFKMLLTMLRSDPEE